MRCLNSEVDVLLSCSCHFPFIHLYPLLETATISWQTVWPYWFSGQGSLCCPLVALQTAKRKYCNMYQTYFFLICINYAMLKLFQKLWGNQYSSLLSVSRSMFGSICTIGVDFEVGVTAHSSVPPPPIFRELRYCIWGKVRIQWKRSSGRISGFEIDVFGEKVSVIVFISDIRQGIQTKVLINHFLMQCQVSAYDMHLLSGVNICEQCIARRT